MDTEGLTDELAAFLASHQREDAYRVAETLKRSPTETTEVVYFTGSNGSELGPFVRKEIELSAGTGKAYEALWRAQHAGLRLAHVPRLVECRTAGNRLTVVMEYVEGETIASLVERVGASGALALAVMPAVCDAVAELHEALDPPLVHRDLKPSNIILTGVATLAISGGSSSDLEQGAQSLRSGIGAVIIDFGIARTYRAGAQTDTTHFGTRGYAAPEQFGFGQTDVRSDVYALGMLAAFCCTGEQPSGVLDASALQSGGVPGPLARVIARAAAFDPADRFATVREFRAALLAAADEVAVAEDAEVLAAQAVAAGSSGFLSDSVTASVSTPFKSNAADPGQFGAPVAPVRPDRCGEGGNKSTRAKAPQSWHPRTERFVLLGRIWNVVLFLMLLFLYAVYAHVAIVPEGEIAHEPIWYLVTIILLIFVPETALLLAMVADRRRWPEHLPLIGAPTLPRLLVALLITVSAGLTILVALTAVKDALGA